MVPEQRKHYPPHGRWWSNLGIPDTVVASGGQYYYKHHGDMPDVFNSVFNYPERGLTLTYNATLKNDVYQQSRILGSEATMDIDRAVVLYRNQDSERYKNIQIDPSDPLAPFPIIFQ